MTREVSRCGWARGDEALILYHDSEWGVPVHDEHRHFEFLVLEGAQAGLSWLTVLRKRDAYRRAYRGFDPARVARFGKRDIERLMGDPGIVRNRAKIESSINNAKRFLEIQKEFGSFDAYIWKWTNGRPQVNRWRAIREVPPASELSDEVSKDLKARGFSFVGSTIIYSHLQAVGVINDHLASCFRWAGLAARNRGAGRTRTGLPHAGRREG